MRTREKKRLEKMIETTIFDHTREWLKECLEKNIYPFKKDKEKSNKIKLV